MIHGSDVSHVFLLVDYMPMGKLIRNTFGVRSGVAAVYMLHAVANGNPMVRIVAPIIRPRLYSCFVSLCKPMSPLESLSRSMLEYL